MPKTQKTEYWSYDRVKSFISGNCFTKEDYRLLCESNNNLPLDPEKYYNHFFRGWIDFLSILEIYYDLEMCKLRVKELMTPDIRKKDYSDMCKLLKEQDNNFPPSDLWMEYYNVNTIKDIIPFSNIPRIKKLVLVKLRT